MKNLILFATADQLCYIMITLNGIYNISEYFKVFILIGNTLKLLNPIILTLIRF